MTTTPPGTPSINHQLFSLHGCEVIVRRWDDDDESLLFISASPPVEANGASAQSRAIYQALSEVLRQAGADFGAVTRETLLLADIRADLAAVRSAREELLANQPCSPALLEIEQPPLNTAHRLEVALQASLRRASGAAFQSVSVDTECDFPNHRRADGLSYSLGGEERLHAAAIYGSGETAYDQTLSMFETANELLAKANMDFRDVVRTWIHLSHMERDYAELNRARRAFFEAHAVSPSPASTGIGGRLVSPLHSLSLGFYAVKESRIDSPGPARHVMKTPTLNEAPQYGADFSRGMRIEQGAGSALFVSGTASLDETGATVHAGDIAAQIDRMLLNLNMLLQEQGAGFGDVVTALTYLKHPSDAPLLRAKLAAAGFEGFPNNLVNAEVCRPDLLCEIELLAMKPGH